MPRVAFVVLGALACAAGFEAAAVDASGSVDDYLDADDVLAEIRRLSELGLQDAVQAIVEGTSTIAFGHEPDSPAILALVDKFEDAVLGYNFMGEEDSLALRSLFTRSIALLAAAARERASSSDDEEH